MKKIFYILTITTTALTTGLTCSCTDDDEYYNSDMFTRAEGMTTRSPETDGGTNDVLRLKPGNVTDSIYIIAAQMTIKLNVRWSGTSSVATVSYINVTNHSSELSYTDTLNIDRKIKRYKFEKCEIDKFAQYSNGMFQLDAIRIYYRKANEEYGNADGTYGPKQMESFIYKYEIPKNYFID